MLNAATKMSHEGRGIFRPRRLQALWLLGAISVLAALGSAPAASAANDPVASASFDLQLSSAFHKQLRRAGVAMKPRAFRVRSGAIHPLTGAGSLSLDGSLRFVRHGERIVFKKLSVELGPAGALSGTAVSRGGRLKPSSTRIFGLAGGSVSRDGFGALISGVDVKLLRSGAKSLKRRLDARAVRAGAAGSLSVASQPQTVEVITGMATVTPASGPGSVSAKLAAHCVDPSSGVTPTGAATQPGGPATTLFFPVTGGTVSPIGVAGVVQQVGGLRLANGGSGLAAGCSSSNTVTIDQSDLAVDFASRHIRTRIAVAGSGAPFGLSGEFEVNFPYDAINATFTADPNTHAVTSGGTVLQLNELAAYYMNQAFPQPSGSFDPAMEFEGGDNYGTASLTLQVR